MSQVPARQAATSPPPAKEPGREALLSAARGCFYQHGYHGTSVRDITTRAGMTAAAIYHYYDSKQSLLVDLMDRFMSWSLAESANAVREAGEDPVGRLSAAVHSHVYQHTYNVVGSFVINNEIRSLTPLNRRHHVSQRDQVQQLFDDAVADGVRSGDFLTPHPKESSRAVVTMCTAVASWYRPDGELNPEEVCDRYVRMALGLVQLR